MNSQVQSAAQPATAPAENKQVYFLVYASTEDFQSLETVIKDWKAKNNKTFDKVGIISDLKNIPIVQINDKKS